MSGEEEPKNYVATVIRDDFFSDPFFKDWWGDFKTTLPQLEQTMKRQVSETPGRRGFLDNFFALRDGREGYSSSSSTSQSASMQLKNGVFSIEVDIQDFDPEDFDIKVENGFILLMGKHEVQRGNNISVRQFNQRFALPDGIDVGKLATNVTKEGKLVISAPQAKDELVAKAGQEGTEVESSSSAQSKKVTSEAAFEVEGGHGATKSVEDMKKKQEQTTTKRETEDGYEEEIIEEYEEEVTVSTTTTTVVSGSGAGAGQAIPMVIEGSAAGTQTVETADSAQTMKAKDGVVIDMQKSASQNKESKEMVIPIQIQGRPAIEQKIRTPKPRMLPFEFPSLPSLPVERIDLSMPEFNMPMMNASDMMAQMQMDMQKQMSQMQQSTMQSMQMDMMSNMQHQTTEQHQATSSVHQQMSSMQQMQQQSMESVEEMMAQDIFVPLKQACKVNQSALSEATAMAKMRNGMFELVVNINGYEPEDVKVHVLQQSVVVIAEKLSPEGYLIQKYEQKFNLPEDVDTVKLTSGMSRDGVLMIRVPKRASPERIIPIKKEVKIEAVNKALSQCLQSSFEYSESSAETFHSELQEKNIVPMNVEKPEDAIKAASAEIVEAMTIGVSENVGAEAGELAGAKAGTEAAKASVADAVAKAVTEAIQQIGMDVAGEAGVKAAMAAAFNIGVDTGAKVAGDMGAETGAEVGRSVGAQAASIAAAEELAKIDISTITEEKAAELQQVFEDLGKNAGEKAGSLAGKSAGDNIDPAIPIKEAVAAAIAAAEKAALAVKDSVDDIIGDAEALGCAEGEVAGKDAGAVSGECVAVEKAIEAAKTAAAGVVLSILGPNAGDLIVSAAGNLAEELAKKLGKELGAAAGLAAGRFAGGKAALEKAKEEALKVDIAKLSEDEKAALKEKINNNARVIGKDEGTKAGKEAGENIDIEAIVGQAVEAAKKLAESQALDIKAFEAMSSDIAKEAGKESGEQDGAKAGAIAGEKVAVEKVVAKAIEAAIKLGTELHGEAGANIAKSIAETVATDIAMKMGNELGMKAGKEAGLCAGEKAGEDAGKIEAAKHNALDMKPEDIDQLKNKLKDLGTNIGKEVGTIAGTEAGSKIDLKLIEEEAMAAALKAAEQAVQMAKASETAAEVAAFEKLAVECAKEAGSQSGEENGADAAMALLDEFVNLNFDKVAEEAGKVKGSEIFGEFGGNIGAEAGLTAGRKVALETTKKLLLEAVAVEGKSVGASLGEKAGQIELSKLVLKDMSKEKVATLCNLFKEVGKNAAKAEGMSIAQAALKKINIEAIVKEVKSASMVAAEKYAIKAREFQKLATKIAEEAGESAGEEVGEELGGDAGEVAGGVAGEKAGREAGKKSGEEIAGEDGGKVGAEAGSKAGHKFGLKVGREAGYKAAIEVGRLEGRKAGGMAGAAEALKHFKIGITKEKVAAMKKLFAEVGRTAGREVSLKVVKVAAVKRGEEEGSKFGYEHGKKAGAAAARKLKDGDDKLIREEGEGVGERVGGEAGEKAGEDAGEKAGGDEAARIGGDEGERIGREIAGEEGAKLGREIGAEAARLAGMKLGKKLGKTAGAKAGRSEGKKACLFFATKISLEISRDKVTAMRKQFAEIATSAGQTAAMKAARAEVMKSVHEVAMRAAMRSVREKLLAMATQKKIQLSDSWRPTALIAVINARSDLSDMDKIKLAAKAKMEGNLGDLLPKRFAAGAALGSKDDSLSGKLEFKDSNTSEQQENVDNTKKWKTVVFSDLPDDPSKKDVDMSKEKVSSLKKRFETSSMKNNEAYVIM